jgi:AGZA family xanthine/uracil permease-like MFS transporter
MKSFLNKLFKIEENQSTIRTEIIAGITTFFAMCYIILVNPNSMSGATAGPIWNACFVGGIIGAVVATVCMAFIANKPFCLAAGMGLNSFFFVSFILPNIIDPKDGYQAGLAVILLSGLIFLVLSLTGLRKLIATAMPHCLKAAIPAGIGLFIAFIGLQNAGIVVVNPYTCVSIADFTKGASVFIPVLTAFLGLIAIVVFSLVPIKVLNKCSIIFGILTATAFYYVLSLIFVEDYKLALESVKLGTVFKDWAELGLVGAFTGFKPLFDGTTVGSIFTVIMLVITYCLIDMFDTLGTVYGTATEANMLDENGDPKDLQEIMLCDSVGTAVGACVGTSTITTFVESASGVAAGGRTGLTALVTALLFALCLFIAPIAQFIPSAATAPALIYVGVLMCKNIVKVDFNDLRNAAPAFMTFLMMVVTYSITNGIMIGALTYTLITLCTGKFTKKDIVVAIIALLGVLRFAFVTM